MSASSGAAFLGPESPRPFSVITEYYQDKLNIPQYPEYQRYSFGSVYEDAMYKLIHKYLELDTHHRFCYVGEMKGSFAHLIKDKFCLLEPMVTVIPGYIHYEDTPQQSIVPVKIANVGADEYFRREGSNCIMYRKQIFDRILVNNAIPYLDHPRDCYKNMINTLEEFGKIVFIHRPGPMNSLPFFNDAKQRFIDTDLPYMKIISDLQSCGADVNWEIETLPIIIPKIKWLSMLREKFPPQMEIISNFEIDMGIRELSEGILKYEGDIVEFTDRLLFITVSRSTTDGYPSVQRHGSGAFTPNPGTQELHYKMNVTPDIKKYVLEKSRMEKLRNEQEQRKQESLW